MSYIQREMDRIARGLREPQPQDKQRELYVAQQALAWALDPSCYRAPTDLIAGNPIQAVTGTPAGTGDCRGYPRHSPS
jgi:hypothetical protein